MADSEFEEFRRHFDQMPQYIKAPARCYTLVHDITPCEEPPNLDEAFSMREKLINSSSSSEEEIARNVYRPLINENRSSSEQSPQAAIDRIYGKKTERRRRKLPEIPKSNERSPAQRSLAEELFEVEGKNPTTEMFSKNSGNKTHPKKKHHFRPTVYYKSEEQSPSESDVWPGTDGDSGNSTVHSPEMHGAKAYSPYVIQDECSPSSSNSSSSASGGHICKDAESLEATHRGLHKFVPRHPDEIEIDIGDPVYVQNEADDCWCEGINLRTRRQGIFPSAFIVDVNYEDFDPDNTTVKKERYVLHYLGSVETLQHKGEEVLIAAVKRIRNLNPAAHPYPCVIEISDQGLHMTDKSKPSPNHVPCHDYFFALKNVTFCGFHPTDPQYLGFISKHPTEQRFACHVFTGNGSTRHVAEAIGRAFQRFYQKFIELAYPIHEFYME